MLIENIVAPYIGTNCWIIAPTKNSECFIVDPGIDNPNMVTQIKDVINKYNLKPISILLTHGHLDHTFSVLPLSKQYNIPAYIHGLDRKLVKDPFKALDKNGGLFQLMNEFGVTKFEEPDELLDLNDNQELNIAGLNIAIQHAPGHTAGSIIATVASEYLISGDVLFAGSIGRTDLPTGSEAEMLKTLKTKILTLPDELKVLPGHGMKTTIGAERRANPYLQPLFTPD